MDLLDDWYFWVEMPKKVEEDEVKPVVKINSRKRKLNDARNFNFLTLTKGLLFGPPEKFDTEVLLEALKCFSSCTEPNCNPLLRCTSLYFRVCDDCRPHLIKLLQMLVLSEDLENLREHSMKAFEYVAQMTSSANYDEAKNKGAFSYSHLQKLCRRITILLQRSFQIPDVDLSRMKKCSLMTCIIMDDLSHRSLAFRSKGCQLEYCRNKAYAKFIFKHKTYSPQTFAITGSSDEMYEYDLCRCHAYCFSSIHRMMHSFYNAHCNFSYWIEQSNMLHETFGSKLNVKVEGVIEDQLSTSVACSLGIDQIVFQQLTDSFVNIFVNLQCKMPAILTTHNTDRVWIVQIIKMKCEKLLNISSEVAPELMKKWEKTRSMYSIDSRAVISRLVYRDPE